MDLSLPFEQICLGALKVIKPWQTEKTRCRKLFLRTRFLDDSQFCHSGNIVSSSKICFCFTAETFLLTFLATCFLVLPGFNFLFYYYFFHCLA